MASDGDTVENILCVAENNFEDLMFLTEMLELKLDSMIGGKINNWEEIIDKEKKYLSRV